MLVLVYCCARDSLLHSMCSGEEVVPSWNEDRHYSGLAFVLVTVMVLRNKCMQLILMSGQRD